MGVRRRAHSRFMIKLWTYSASSLFRLNRVPRPRELDHSKKFQRRWIVPKFFKNDSNFLEFRHIRRQFLDAVTLGYLFRDTFRLGKLRVKGFLDDIKLRFYDYRASGIKREINFLNIRENELFRCLIH